MMGFITGFSRSKCDICNKEFLVTYTGINSSAYDDFSCIKCDWIGKVCEDCRSKPCVKCGSQIKSTHEKYKEHIIYY